MRNLKSFNNFSNRNKFNESNWTDGGGDENIKRTADQIYNLVKNRPFCSKQECIRDIVRLLRKIKG